MEAVSEVVGTMILIGVVMVGMGLVAVLLLSGSSPSKVPVLDTIITNLSNTIYIYHKGGDSLWKGQYKILVDGVDRTGLFVSDGSDPWSVGKTLNYTSPTMPKLVVIIANQTAGGRTILTETDLTKMALQPPIVCPGDRNQHQHGHLPGSQHLGGPHCRQRLLELPGRERQFRDRYQGEHL